MNSELVTHIEFLKTEKIKIKCKEIYLSTFKYKYIYMLNQKLYLNKNVTFTF